VADRIAALDTAAAVLSMMFMMTAMQSLHRPSCCNAPAAATAAPLLLLYFKSPVEQQCGVQETVRLLLM